MTGRWKRRWIGLSGGVAALALAAILLSGNEGGRQQALVDAEAKAAYESSLTKAIAGDPQAQFLVAEHLRQGVGVARSPKKAAEWYEKAAARSHVEALYALGILYENGEGVRRDAGRAVDWYRLAVSISRHGGAEFALAQSYYYGRGVPADAGEALSWYRKAADDGHPAAQHILGTIYEGGWNVEPDPVEAYKWFTLAIPNRDQAMAIDRGFDPAAAREDLAKKMTRSQVTRGEKAAARWRPAKTPRAMGRDGFPLVRTLPAAVPAEAPKVPRVAVRLFSFEAPAGPAGATHTALSLFAEFDEPSARASACGQAPRLREAVFQDLWARPLPERAGPPALRAVADRLVPVVNRVLGRNAVRRAFLHPDDRPLAANDILQSPFDAIEECVQTDAGS
ncbi:MAG: sel1 repeat family protein [Rhodospirillales bacterium]|nr:sel1 repeat family protein [Rhodospirillales bacterium]